MQKPGRGHISHAYQEWAQRIAALKPLRTAREESTSEELMQGLDRRGAFPYSGGDSLDGAASYVANSKHTGQTGFHWQR